MASTAAQAVFNGGWTIRAPHLVSDNRRSGFAFEQWGVDTCLGMLSLEAMRELESIMTISEYNAGDNLFLEQLPLNHVFIVITGDVRLSMQSIGGRRLTIQIAKRGAVLGMDSVLNGTLSGWSADTLYPSRIGVIGQGHFHRFAEMHPEIYRIASKEISGMLQNACSALRIVGLSSCVRKRLASQLLTWGERGNKSGDQTQFRLAMTHTQIAECIGAVRETVTRGLIVFKQRGLVEIRGSILRIPSMAALRKFVEDNESRL